MKTTIKNVGKLLLLSGVVLAFSACSKNDDSGPSDEQLRQDSLNKVKDSLINKYGYAYADTVAHGNLVAYWNFDNNAEEQISGTDPAKKANMSYVTGLKGEAVKLDTGYLYYDKDISALDDMTTFTVSAWVQVQNDQNPAYTSMLFQLTKPDNIFGNINLGFETGKRPAGNDTLVVHGWYTDPNGGLQDNRNDPFGETPVGVFKNPADTWVHVAITVDKSNPVNFLVYANGQNIGAYSQRGTSYYTPITPTSIIIGGWTNNVPGIYNSGDTWPHAFVGKVDELRVYNKALTPLELKALYNLELIGR